jgi:3-dehydroquinate dehydratase-2
VIYILNGPNLNFLGEREPSIYGSKTLEEIKNDCLKEALKLNLSVDFRQTNTEGTLIDWVQEAAQNTPQKVQGLIINGGAYTHTSVALYDALKMLTIPLIELHISNPHKREPFRHHSFISPAAHGIVAGFGPSGYTLALSAIKILLERPTNT